MNYEVDWSRESDTDMCVRYHFFASGLWVIIWCFVFHLLMWNIAGESLDSAVQLCAYQQRIYGAGTCFDFRFLPHTYLFTAPLARLPPLSIFCYKIGVCLYISSWLHKYTHWRWSDQWFIKFTPARERILTRRRYTIAVGVHVLLCSYTWHAQIEICLFSTLVSGSWMGVPQQATKSMFITSFLWHWLDFIHQVHQLVYTIPFTS